MQLVSQSTVNAIMELVGESFLTNRMLDRCQTIIGVKFVYSQTASYIHHYLAHWASSVADEIVEKCTERYNIPTYYPATPAGDKDYNSVVDAILDVEQIMIHYQTAFMGCCKVAFENNDIQVYADLLDILEEVNKATEQAILIADKIRIYGDKPSYDNHIKTFWFFGVDDD